MVTDRRLRFRALGIAADGHAEEGDRLALPEAVRVVAPVADLCAEPFGARDRQLRYGETVDMLLHQDGAAFARRRVDGYVGWVALAALAEPLEPGPTHFVSARQSFAFSKADIKSPEQGALSLGAKLRVQGWHGTLAETEAGFVPGQHLRALTSRDADPVTVAETLLGTAYLWGGDSAFGIDCSGLVALCFRMAGKIVPGDSDLQAAQAGDALPLDAAPQRGDLWFWRGHVAIIRDETTLIHANAHHMSVAIEDIAAACTRIEAAGDGPVTAKRRVPG